MRLLDTFIFSIGEVLTIMSCILISITFFEQKINLKKSVMFSFVLLVSLCYMINHTFLQICIGFIFEFLTFFMVLEASLLRKTLIFLITAFSEAFANIIIEGLILTDAWIFGTHNILLTKIITVFVFFFLYLVSVKMKYKKNHLDYIPYYSYVNLLISISFILIPLILLHFSDYPFDPFIYNLLFIVICLAFISNFVFFLNHNNKLIENSDYKLQISYKEQLLKLQKQYTEDVVKSYKDLKKYRHDYLSNLNTIEYLIRNKEYDKLQNFVNDTEKELNQTVIQCSDIYLAATVNQLYKRIEAEGIEFIFQYHPVKELHMNSVHICSLFYNLISNAIEAAMHCEKKKIELMISSNQNTLLIEISNSVNKEFCLKNVENHITIKASKESHGLGLLNIKEIIHSYHGDMTLKQEKEMFYISIILMNAI